MTTSALDAQKVAAARLWATARMPVESLRRCGDQRRPARRRPGADVAPTSHATSDASPGALAERYYKAARDGEPGTIPGGWVRWAESVLPSRVDCRRILAAEVRSAVAAVAGKVDYSYRRPSRR